MSQTSIQSLSLGVVLNKTTWIQGKGPWLDDKGQRLNENEPDSKTKGSDSL